MHKVSPEILLESASTCSYSRCDSNSTNGGEIAGVVSGNGDSMEVLELVHCTVTKQKVWPCTLYGTFMNVRPQVNHVQKFV